MIKIRPASLNDLSEIIEIYEAELLRKTNPTFIETSIKTYPVFIAESGEELVGFVYCRQFSPDILEPANILIKNSYRDKGIGKLLMNEVEKAAREKYAALILVNSTLHNENPNKRNATNFYLSCGYDVILKTDNSTVFSKILR